MTWTPFWRGLTILQGMQSAHFHPSLWQRKLIVWYGTSSSEFSIGGWMKYTFFIDKQKLLLEALESLCEPKGLGVRNYQCSLEFIRFPRYYRIEKTYSYEKWLTTWYYTNQNNCQSDISRHLFLKRKTNERKSKKKKKKNGSKINDWLVGWLVGFMAYQPL